MSEVQYVQIANAVLGESPIWDSDQGVLYWIDAERPAIFRWNLRESQTGQWPMPRPVGCISRAHSGRLIVADTEGIGLLDLATGTLLASIIGHPDGEVSVSRLNDGKVDRAGRLWVGTRDEKETHPVGSLYRLDTDLRFSRMDTGFICSNGLGWSPDNRTMYFTDSVARTIWAYDFVLSTGALGARRLFAKLADNDGMPDGLTVDIEGFVWSAIWDGWRVIRYAPDGTIDREIQLPVQRPTSCAFGGPDLRTLFITSASIELSLAALSRGPLAGSLFAVDPGVAGLPEVPFGT